MSSKTPGRDSTSRSQSGLFVATFSTVLALIASGLNPLIPAEPAAATANVIATGTSPASVCNQVVDNNSGVTAQRLADGDCVVRFTAVRTTNWTAPSGVTQVTYLVVAGGGGGAGGHGSEHGGGGGGAGGVGTGTLNVSTATLSIAVGTGGAFGANRSQGTSGANSSLGAITMTGGGGGGTYYLEPLTGGSGGGAGAGAHLAGATGTLSQGNSGGSVNISGNKGRHGAGGGGAGGAGGNATSSGGSLTTGAGAGGAGSPSSITGSSLFYGGGGGGGGSSNNGGTGGASGGSSIGGAGATWTGSATTQATAGATNTGSGGGGGIGTGGSNDTVGGAGGSGVVIVRYAIPPNAPTIDSVTGVNQSLSVAFTAPISNDATITGYQYSINNGSNWISTGGTTSPFTISGLTNGTTYTVLLRALSSTSFSPASTSFSPASTGVTGTPLADCAPETTTSGGYTYVAFKNLGTCNWTPSAGVTRVDILVVGGGGGGGSRHGGGGGGGGLIQETNVLIAGSALAITVGAGGAGGAGGGSPGPSVDVGDKGEASVVSGVGITTRTANGGGGGGAHDTSGGVGGSGGGGGAFVPALGGAVQTAGQGNAGSAGQNNGSTHYVGGGGGGAGSVGTPSLSTQAGSGGAGLEIAWISTGVRSSLGVGVESNSKVFFAGGGGGGSDRTTVPAGDGGSGGGAVGAAGVALSSSGITNTGGGGGGAGVGNEGSWPGGNGGSGVVVLRYINAPVISIANSTISATVGTAVTGYSIGNSGGEIASYAISPALSVPGLTFSTVTGLISGSPSSAVTSASYTVTATNTSGTSSATFSITSAAAAASVPATGDDYSLHLAGISRSSARGGSVGSAVAIVPNSQSFSWEAWINPTAPTSFGQRYVLDSFSGSGSDGAARLWIQGAQNNAVFAFRYDSAEADRDGVTWNSGTNYVRYGEWQHVAVTYQRSTEGDCSVGSTVTATLYIDGVQAGQNTGSNIGCLAPKGLSIGDATEDAFNNEFFAGKIDQVKIWEGALTQAEVAASMTSYARGTIDNTLRAHYGFNELGASAVAGDVVQNLAPSGSGYDLGLFAQTSSNVANNVTRSLNVFSVSYAGNGSTSGSVATETAGPYASVQIAGQGTLLRTSHAFNNWHTTASGTTGVNYAAGDSYQMSYFDLDLYAKWTSLIQTVTPTVAYGNAIFSPSLTITPTINTNNHDGSPTFTSTSQSVCTVNIATGVATVVRAGTCSISINFPLTAAYESATVTASFTIDKANQAALTWNQAQISYDHLGTLNLSAAISGGNVSPSGNLSFIGQGSCTATGSVVSGGAAGSSCSVTATLAGDSGYNPVSITQTITINKINQAALGIANPGTVTFGETIQLSSTGGSGTGAISFSSASTSICTETANDGEFEIIAVGDCVVQVTRAADTNYNSQSGSRTITSVKATHALSFTSAVPANPIVNGSYSVTGSSSTNQVGLSPSFRIVAGSSSICSLAGSTVSFLLDGVCEIEAFRGATNNYEAAQTITQRIVVGQANQSITFAAPASKTFGDPAFTVSGTSSSANTVTFSPGPGTTNSACSVTSGGLVVIAAVGTCEIVANSASGNGYAAASPVARSFAVAPDTAGAPFITAVSFGDQSLTATYFAPGYLGGGTISGYRLQAFSGANLVATQSSCAISGTLSCTITGLTNGTSYTLKIAAITEAGLGAESPASAAVAPAANPEAVSGLTAVQGNQKLTISWRAPSNLGGGVLDSFRIFHREAGAGYPSVPITLFAANLSQFTVDGLTTYEITGLTNGQAYDVRVVTVTEANTSQLTSNTAEVTQTPYSVPDAPLSVTVLEVGDDIVITWSQPVFDGGSAISGFSVLLDSVAANCTATSTTTCTIPKSTLTPGTTINIAVKAENDAGLSAPSTTTFTMASAVVVGSPSVTTGPSIQTPEGPAAGIEAVKGETWAWTKRISKNQVKVYIKFPEMGTNYQIRFQKNDGRFVRVMSKTVNSTSYEGLRVVGDWYYLVRTITLPGEGRYRIELTQDDNRMVLNGENRPAVYSYR